jgi:POLQ-like helicase
MKLEYNSKRVLAVTKSKAKQFEFKLDEQHHSNLAGEPRNLLILSIGILGELASLERHIQHEISDNSHYTELKSQLILIAQYFDALDQGSIENENSVYLKLVGASAYYLAEMPGSASVLAKQLALTRYSLTTNNIEGPLVWMLRAASNSDSTMSYSDISSVNDIIFYYVKFSSGNASAEEVVKACIAAEHHIYTYGDDRELFFIDILIAVTKRRLKNSSRICLPQFTDIPIDRWLPSLSRPDFIKEFWPAQRLLGENGIFRGSSAVVQMPTSAGKTKSTEILIRSAFLSERAKLAVIIAPFRALCREISDSFRTAFRGENVSINELADTPQVDDKDLDFLKFLMGEKFRDPRNRSTVMVSTPEKMVYLLRHNPELAEKIGLLIFDEGHQFDTGLRGVTYELLVGSLRSSIPVGTQVVLISAVMGNATSIGDWLYGENGVEVQGAHCLPTVRSVAFASWENEHGQLNYIDNESVSERDFIVPQIIEKINVGRNKNEKVDRIFPDRKDPPTVPAYLGLRLSQLGPVAIFCGTKTSVNSICDRIVKYYDRGLLLDKPLAQSDTEEISKLSHLAKLHFGPEDLVSRAIEIGVLPHSKAVPNGLRVAIEWAMTNNRARLVVCTSTLSQGVNLPIKYLIITSIWQAGEEIKRRDFHNLMGRAGRSGYHTEGSIIFSDLDLFEKRHTRQGKWKWAQTLNLLDMSNADECVSSLKELVSPGRSPEWNWDVLAFIRDPDEYRKEVTSILSNNPSALGVMISQMKDAEAIVQKIESFMLSVLKDKPDVREIDYFAYLATETLAYYLASEEERLLLIKSFREVAEHVLNVDPAKIAYYGKALLGIRQLKIIEGWADEMRFELTICEEPSDALKVCWPLLLQLASSEIVAKLKPEVSLLQATLGWINGKSYADLLNEFTSANSFIQTLKSTRAVKMSHVVDFTDSALAYDAMLVTGALADIVENTFNNPVLTELLRKLQQSLKIGLSNDFEKWLFSKGFVDREICKQIRKAYDAAGLRTEGFDYRILRENQEILEQVLEQFPYYFSQIGQNN